ncbi:MAG TPA: branched-chain-amino-acid transaminase [Candidatus Acidoferrales bacterium]|nr:branched-chain-amino-acid transaminase [Candidatus Acidoferrales bacterium]
MGAKELVVYVDGQWLPKSNASISVFDHGMLYGDGVFEGIRVYKGVIFQFKEHLDRLYSSAKSIKLQIPLTPQDMTRAIVETLKRNGLKDAYIRLVITRGVGDLGVDPRKCRKASAIVITEPVDPTYGMAAKQKGISVIFSSVRRDAIDATTHEIKSLNYLNSVMAKQEALDAGADDALMLDRNGFVSEATTTNLFIVKEGDVITPPSSAGILPGVTRKRIIHLARDLGYKVLEKGLTPYDVTNADEAFLTGTLSEIVPIAKVRGITVGDGKVGPITHEIMDAFVKARSDPKEGLPLLQEAEGIVNRK